MPNSRPKFEEGVPYHVYNRGAFKHAIFHDDEDRDFMLSLLFTKNIQHADCAPRYGQARNFKKYLSLFKMSDEEVLREWEEVSKQDRLVDITQYVLMGNHFHILMVSRAEVDNLTSFMHSVGTTYSMYYNEKYKKTGGLYEGRFKAKPIVDSFNFLRVKEYIHNNPLKHLLEGVHSAQIINPDSKDFKSEDLRDNAGMHISTLSSQLGVTCANKLWLAPTSKHDAILKGCAYSSYIDHELMKVGKLRPESCILSFPEPASWVASSPRVYAIDVASSYNAPARTDVDGVSGVAAQ